MKVLKFETLRDGFIAAELTQICSTVLKSSVWNEFLSLRANAQKCQIDYCRSRLFHLPCIYGRSLLTITSGQTHDDMIISDLQLEGPV